MAPVAKARAPVQRVIGERFLVPASLWPDYDCGEHGGAGWEVTVVKRQGSQVVVRWAQARGANGEVWADSKLKLSALVRLNADGQMELSEANAVWRRGILSDQLEACDGPEAAWSPEEEATADYVERSALEAMAVGSGVKPMTIKAALAQPGDLGKKAQLAVDAELGSLIDDFGCLCPVVEGDEATLGHKVFGLGGHCLWKEADSLKPARCKCRLFVQGQHECAGIDYAEVQSPVHRLTAFNLVLAIAAVNSSWSLHHSDVTAGFAQVKKDVKPILCRMPEGLREYKYVDGERREVLYWVYNLYGRHDAGRRFVQEHRSWFFTQGYQCDEAEPCLFYRKDHRGTSVACVYVDDVAWLHETAQGYEEDKAAYQRRFVSSFGVLSSFLGVEVERDTEHGVVKTHQNGKIVSMANVWLPSDCPLRKRPPSRPCDEGLLKLVSPAALKANPECTPELRKSYQSLIGSLLYICLCRRPDCCYAVGLLGRANQNPTPELMQRALIVAAYMLSTQDYVVEYTREAGLKLEAYSDASFEEWGATTGVFVLLAGAVVLALSKRQRCVTTSTCAAELVAMSVTAAEVVYIRRLLEMMGYAQTAPTPLYVDNKASEAVAKDPVLNNGMKHVARRHYYAKEMQADGEIEVTWVETKLNLADALTKALALPLFVSLTSSMRRVRVLGGRALSAMRVALARAEREAPADLRGRE